MIIFLFGWYYNLYFTKLFFTFYLSVKTSIYHFKQQANTDSQESGEDISVGKYGILKMIQSSKNVNPDRVFVDVKNIITVLADNSVWIRGRLHTSRAKGN